MLARLNLSARRVVTILVAFLVGAPMLSVGEEDRVVERELELRYADEWIAERHGTKLTLQDVIGRLQDVPREDRAAVVSSPERVARILNDMLINYGMAERAIERGLLEDPAVRAEIFYRTMYVLARHEQQALFEEEQLDDYSLRAREYYLANPEEFTNLEELTFTHVLFRASAEDGPVAEDLAGRLLEQLDSPADLDAVDLDPLATDGITINRSTIEEVTPDQLDRAFAAGIERMEPGDLALLESRFGVHVVRLDARIQGGQRDFEEVRQALEQRARQRHHDQILRQRLEAFYADSLNLADGAVERIIESQAPADD
jgi:peptidyl-prolyl cis-trans isomerase C